MKEPVEIYAGHWMGRQEAARKEAWDEQAGKSSLKMKRGLVGVEGSGFKIVTGCDGSFVPEPYPLRVNFWVLDRTTGRLFTPETMNGQWSIEEGRLPISTVTLEDADLRIDLSVFARKGADNGEMVTWARVAVQNGGAQEKDLDCYVVITTSPFADVVGMGPQTLQCDTSSTVLLSGRPFCRIHGGTEKADGDLSVTWAGIKAMSGGVPEDLFPSGGFAVVRRQAAGPGLTVCWDVEISSHAKISPACECATPRDYESDHRKVVEEWRNRTPLRIDLPDKRYADCFYSSLNYMLLMKTGKELWPGPRNYRSFFLHDAVDMTEALDKAGLAGAVRDSLDVFHFREGDGYLDAIGGCAYALYSHYLLTRDKEYLDAVYPRIVENSARIQALRAVRSRAPFDGTEFSGLMPPSVSQDNFKLRAHLYLDNWWGVIGLRTAALAAAALGRTAESAGYFAASQSYLADVLRSIGAVMKRDGASSMPSFADYWPPENCLVDGDHRLLGATQKAWAHRPALCPGSTLDLEIPRDLFRTSYELYWKEACRLSAEKGAWFVEYEGVFWGYNVLLARPLVFLGMNEVALSNVEWSVQNQSCPGGWCEAMNSRVNGDGKRELAEGVIIGDVPHGWSAAHYVLLLREMLLQETGDALTLLPCVPDAWTDEGKVIEVHRAPTFFGPIDFRTKSQSGGQELHFEIEMKTPPAGGFRIQVPRTDRIDAVWINGTPVGAARQGPLLAPPETNDVRITYR